MILCTLSVCACACVRVHLGVCEGLVLVPVCLSLTQNIKELFKNARLLVVSKDLFLRSLTFFNSQYTNLVMSFDERLCVCVCVCV